MSNKKSMLDAFVEQTYGSYTKAKEAEDKAIERENFKQELSNYFQSKSIEKMSSDQDIKSFMPIPSKM